VSELRCGFGLLRTNRDTEADRYVREIVKAYAHDQNKKTGQFPRMDDQIDVAIRARDRFEQGDADQWDWADEQAWAALVRMFEGTEFEPDRNDRIMWANELRIARSNP